MLCMHYAVQLSNSLKKKLLSTNALSLYKLMTILFLSTFRALLCALHHSIT